MKNKCNIECFEDRARRNALRGRCHSKTSSHESNSLQNHREGEEGKIEIFKRHTRPFAMQPKGREG